MSAPNPPPKKRSLSSYLSNVSSRKEELEKLEQKRLKTMEESSKENKIEPPVAKVETHPPKNSSDHKSGTNIGPSAFSNGIHTEPPITNNTTNKEQPSIIKPVTNTPTQPIVKSITHTQPTIKNDESHPQPAVEANVQPSQSIKSETNQKTVSSEKIEPVTHTNVKSFVPSSNPSTETSPEPLSEKTESQTELKTHIIELVNESRRHSRQGHELEVQEIVATPIKSEHDHTSSNQSHSHLNKFSRDDLREALKDPSVLASSPQKAEEEEEEVEIGSDTETPQGSPIKIKKGRLIRGDKLRRLSSVLNSTNYNNDSDSELSDINDGQTHDCESTINQIKITSSFLNEGNNGIPSSPVMKRKSSKPKNIAISKNVRNKKSIYRDSGGRTKLQIACDKGKLDTVKKLLNESTEVNNGVDVNDQDNAGNTPLHEAALNGHLDIVELLLDHGANVNIQSYEMFQDTPLIDASANGHLDVVEFLLSKGADPTITNAKGLTAYEAIEEDSDLDDQERELVKEIKTLLRKGTRLWMKKHGHDKDGDDKMDIDDDGKKNVHVQIDSHHDTDDIAGTNDNDKNNIEFYWTDLTSKAGKDKLMQASKEGYLAYVGQYLENGGRIDYKSFLESVRFGHEDIASLFLAFGAQVNKVNKDDNTPLMVAVGRGHLGTVKLLLEAGADPNIKNKKGHTALYYAKNSILGVKDDNEIELLTKVIRERGGSVDEENVEKVSLKNKPIQEGKSIRENKPVPDSKPIHDTKPIRESKSTNETQTFKENKVIKEVEPIVEKSALESIFDESTSDNKDANVEAKNDDDGDDLEEEDDEDEEEIIPTSKYRHNSPSFSVVVPDKNKTVIPDSDATSYIHEETSHAEQTPVKHEETPLKHVETEKERLERIKCEEEYLQRKLQNKRRKELELIHKLQEDERKRVEEKVKLELAEQAKLKEVTKQKELEEERRVREFELERRRRIRELYPLGLKLINFNKTAIPEDVTNDFLPLYYMVRDGIKYVLDLQLLVICQDTSMLVHSAGDRSIRITDQDEKLQLWNIHRRTFLFGGDSDREMSFHQARMSQKLKFEGGEFTKFCQLPMSWTPLDNVPVEWRDKLQLLMCQVSDWKSVTPAHSSLQPPQPSQQLRSQPLQQQPLQPLPLKLQHRPHVARCLQQEIDCERQPMW